jgi:hypothetical protein
MSALGQTRTFCAAKELRKLTLSACGRRRVVADAFQESCGWREKHIAGFGGAEIQQTIVVTGGRPTNIFSGICSIVRDARSR